MENTATRTAIIHLGTHKAASTSVQLFLAHNREALAAAGICYPLAPPPTEFAHHGLAWSVIQRYTQIDRRPGNFSLADALVQFEESEVNTLFLSSEDFLTTSFYEGFLEEFFAELRAVFDRVVVCAYVRSRKDFFTSSYNQWIKSLSYSKTFDAYLTQVLLGLRAPMQYTKSLGMWGDLADESVFLPFLPKQFDLSPERHLLSRLGVSEAALESFEPFSEEALNASVGPLAVLACRRLSHSLHSKDWYEHYDHEKTELLLNELEKWIDELGWNDIKFRAVEQRHVDRLREIFAEADDEFAREHLGAANWLELFPQDAEPDQSTEIGYAELDDAKKAEVSDFSRRAFRLARDIHVNGFNPVVAAAEAAAAEAEAAAAAEQALAGEAPHHDDASEGKATHSPLEIDSPADPKPAAGPGDGP